MFSWQSLFGNKVEYSFLYSQIEKAYSELYNRRQITALKTKIELDVSLPSELQRLYDRPHLVFFRQVATPLYETLKVQNIAQDFGLDLLIFEYYDDKFVSTKNVYKRGLGKLPIHVFTAKNGDDIYENATIIDFNAQVGKKIKDIVTVKGESLIDFHHDFYNTITGTNVQEVAVDASAWFNKYPNGAFEYYEKFFSLFVCHGILAEVFGGNKHVTNFTKDIAIPAFKKVKKVYGHKPLIINYQPPEEQGRQYWDCYPNQTNDFLKGKGYI